MSMLTPSGHVDSVFFEQVQSQLSLYLQERGSILYEFTSKVPVIGDSLTLRSFDIGNAEITDPVFGALVKNTDIRYQKRNLTTQRIQIAWQLDPLETTNINDPTLPSKIAQAAFMKISQRLDEMIVKGIEGEVNLLDGKKKGLTKDNYVLVDAEERPDKVGDEYLGLTSYKLMKAASLIRSRGNDNPLVCYCSNNAYLQMLLDPNISSTDFNIQPAMATGQMNPYGEISYFRKGRHCSSGKGLEKPGTAVEYAYVFDPSKIIFGTKTPFQLSMNVIPGTANVVSSVYFGDVGVCRMEEESVVKIEVAKITKKTT